MSTPREDDARRPPAGPQLQPNDRPEPKREAPQGRPEEAAENTPLAEAEINVDDAQLVDPAAEPGKPI